MEKVDCYFIGQIARRQRKYSLDDRKRWSLLTRDFNDIYNQRAARTELSQPLVPGIISEGLIAEVISKELPGTPCVMLKKELLYIQSVFIGDTITAELEIINVNVQRNWISLKVRCMNEHGVDVIKGEIILKLL